MDAGARIVVVERVPDLAERLRGLAIEGVGEVRAAESLDEGVELVAGEPGWDLLLVTDAAFRRAWSDRLELLEVVQRRSPRTAVAVAVAPKEVETARELLEDVPCRCVRMPKSDNELRDLVTSALAGKGERRQAARAPERAARRRRVRAEKPAAKGLHGFGKMVGRSKAMQGVYRQVRQAAATDVPVLLLGETGTGKDLAAQALHSQGVRSEGPFVAVNLGAMPVELVASELFGYEAGAFTGAREPHPGKFEQARGGTILLDEIGTVDEKVQVSLLRLIETKKFHRLGAREERTADVRVIAASNEDLAEAVEGGRFREDLFYRLDVFRIDVPPLRGRRGDIPLLVEEFLGRYNAQFGKSVVGVEPACLAVLEGYDWPGNVRELKNVVQRAVLVCEGETLLTSHLPPRLRPGRQARGTVTFEVGTPLEEVERAMILRALDHTGGNRSRAAALLGISRRALYNRLRKYRTS